MVAFTLLEERLIPLADIVSRDLRQLVDYWDRIRGDRLFPMRRDFDPVEVPKLLRNIRLADVEMGGVFRFRLYSSDSTNPDRRDMTGLTTNDYEDTGFGDLVTRHYAAVAADGVARCWYIKASVATGDYEYHRVVLPLSRTGEKCDILLVKSHRIVNSVLQERRYALGADGWSPQLINIGNRPGATGLPK